MYHVYSVKALSNAKINFIYPPCTQKVRRKIRPDRFDCGNNGLQNADPRMRAPQIFFHILHKSRQYEKYYNRNTSIHLPSNSERKKKMKRIMIAAAVLLLGLFAITAQAQSSVISVGKSYQLITPASAGYPDDGKKLTDGVFAATAGGVGYGNPAFVGFNKSNANANGDFEIIIDLGSVHTDLSKFEISYLHQTDAGIYAPGSVTFSVADTRNGTYTTVGTQTIVEPASTQINKTTVTPDGPISGQFIKVDIKIRAPITDESGGTTVTPSWVFVDEISIYGTTGATSIPSESIPPQTGDGITILAFSIIGLTAVVMLCLIIKERKLKDID